MFICGIIGKKTPLVVQPFLASPDMLWLFKIRRNQDFPLIIGY
jgi:hypothetical protein